MDPRNLLVTLTLAAVAFSGCSTSGTDDGAAGITAKMTITGLDSSRANFQFDANKTQAGNPIAKYVWNFGDGDIQEGNPVVKRYSRIDSLYNVSLVVTDSHGNKGAVFQQLQVGVYANQVPSMDMRNAPRWVKTGTPLRFDSGTSEDHDNDPISRTWIVGPWPGPNVTFETGYMNEGNQSTKTFDQTGVYFLHCHPHPWMKLRVAVDPAAPAPDNLTMTIADFAYAKDNITVPPGTSLTFVNADPLPHTATLEKFVAGTIVGTGKVATFNAPANGKYQLWVWGNDLKGGVAYHAWGLEVGEDAPAFTHADITGGPLAPAGVTTEEKDIGEFTHNATVNATLEFSTPQTATVKLELVPDAGGSAAIVASGSTSPFRADGPVLKGNYRWKVTEQAGVVSSYTIKATITYNADPQFGWAVGGGVGHHH